MPPLLKKHEFLCAGFLCRRVIGSRLGRRGNAATRYGWLILDPDTEKELDRLVPQAESGVPEKVCRRRVEQLRELAQLPADQLQGTYFEPLLKLRGVVGIKKSPADGPKVQKYPSTRAHYQAHLDRLRQDIKITVAQIQRKHRELDADEERLQELRAELADVNAQLKDGFPPQQGEEP